MFSNDLTKNIKILLKGYRLYITKTPTSGYCQILVRNSYKFQTGKCFFKTKQNKQANK